MIEQLIHRIKIRQSELQVALALGSPINWESYQRLVGEHQGLQATLQMINDMLEEEKQDN
jgi:hypothetical protein